MAAPVNQKKLVRSRVKALRVALQEGSTTVDKAVKELSYIEFLLKPKTLTRRSANRRLRPVDAALVAEIKQVAKDNPDTTVVILAERVGTSIDTFSRALRGALDHLGN
ncbi:hypothetical protein [Caulobacter phage DCM]|uniref:Uncharacterized protein n=1 Tax=Caulobacter phage DCM TaxID=3020391 RepID=A0AAF0B9S6_9CAUD|nr:hypothetical protein [Caulobacter phage DCM]WCD56097.1 hypothetical protein [Caulobacter phage BL199]